MTGYIYSAKAASEWKAASEYKCEDLVSGLNLSNNDNDIGIIMLCMLSLNTLV